MKNRREIKTIDRVLEILNSPEKWIKGHNARDKDGHPIYPPNEAAVCWCLEGAIYKALWEQNLTNKKWENSYYKIVHALCHSENLAFNIGNQDEHIGFNDDKNTTYNKVIDLIKKAKEYLSQ